MGIELSFNSKQPHTFTAPQMLEFTEGISLTTGQPFPDTKNLGWSSEITVTGQNQDITVEAGTSSILHAGIADQFMTQPVYANLFKVIADDFPGGFSGGAQGANELSGIKARAELNLASDNTTITSLAAGRFGVSVAGAGVNAITELSAIVIEAPSIAGGTVPTSTVGLRIANHGTNNAIQTGTGLCSFGDRISVNGSVFTSIGMSNPVSSNNANFAPANNGPVITRNVADANPALLINLANAGATGRIVDFLTNGISRAYVTNTGAIKTLVTTVAALPVGLAGQRAFVTDALAPAFGAAVVGGGAVGVPVYHDGVSWKVG